MLDHSLMFGVGLNLLEIYSKEGDIDVEKEEKREKWHGGRGIARSHRPNIKAHSQEEAHSQIFT